MLQSGLLQLIKAVQLMFKKLEKDFEVEAASARVKVFIDLLSALSCGNIQTGTDALRLLVVLIVMIVSGMSAPYSQGCCILFTSIYGICKQTLQFVITLDCFLKYIRYERAHQWR